MTVSSQVSKATGNGDGSNASFVFNFKIFNESDLTVIVKAANGTESLKTIDSHYTITGVGNSAGGNVVFTSGNIPTNTEVVHMIRNADLTQPTDYTPNDPFPAADHEDALDRLTFFDQQQQTQLDRSIKIPKTDAESVELPPKASRLGKVLGFNATSGNVEMFSKTDLSVSDGSTTVSVDLTSQSLILSAGAGISTSAGGTTVTIAGTDASTSAKGIASFNDTFFSVSSGAVSLDATQTGITSLLATDIKIGEDDQTKIDFETANQINFYANNVNVVQLSNDNSGDAVFTVPTSDKDFVIKGNDGGSPVTALSIDMSDAGKATFNSDVSVNGNLTVAGTTTTVNSTTVNIADHNILLDSDNTTGAVINGAGISIKGGSDNATFTYNTIGPKFELKLGSSYEDLQVDNLIGNVTGNVTGTIQTAAQPNITSLGTLTTLAVDDITINGSTISDSGDLTIDSGGDIFLDAAGNEIRLKANGTEFGTLRNDSSDFLIRSSVADKDIKIQGVDGTQTINALTFDMSDAGAATFNDKITAVGTSVFTNLDISGDVDINGTLETDALSINSTTVTATADELNYVDVTTLGTVEASKAVTADANGDVSFPDSKILSFGAESDLQILHNGNNSFIKDSGTGALILQTNDLKVHNAGLTDLMIRAIQGNQVELYYDNGKKLETTSGGIEVTGDLTASENLLTTDGSVFTVRNDQRTTASDLNNSNSTIDSKAMFCHSLVSVNPGGDRYAKIAELPASGSGTQDHITIIGRVGGWLDTNSNEFELTFHNRNAFAFDLHYKDNSLISTIGGIKSYLQSDGTVDIYFFGASSQFSILTYAIPHSHQVTIVEDPVFISSTPSGTENFDSTDPDTYTPALKFPNKQQLVVGTDSDLKIYHDGTNSYIDEGSGTGSLIFKSNLYSFRNAANSAQMAIFNQGGAVELYHNDIKTFETTATGAKIHGNTGDAVLLLEADTTNTDEDDNARIEYSQDGGGITASNGLDNANNFFITTTSSLGTTKFEILGGDRTKLYHATNEKLRTTSTGVSITGNLSVSADTDANAQVGRAHFGHTGSLSDVAGFSHIDHNSDTNFALIQNAAGRTVLNAPSGQEIALTNNDNLIAELGTDGLHFFTGKNLSFEGSANNEFETILTVTNPTADRTVTLPDATGTVSLRNELKGNTTNGVGVFSDELVARKLHTGTILSAGVDSTQGLIAGRPMGGFFSQSDVTADTIFFMPVMIPSTGASDNFTIGSFRFRTGFSGSTANNAVKMGLYSLNKFGYPSQLISKSSANSGTSLSTDILATPDVTSVVPGRYAMALAVNGSGTLITVNFNSTSAGASFFQEGFADVFTSGKPTGLSLANGLSSNELPTDLSSTTGYSDVATCPYMMITHGSTYTGE